MRLDSRGEKKEKEKKGKSSSLSGLPDSSCWPALDRCFFCIDYSDAQYRYMQVLHAGLRRCT